MVDGVHREVPGFAILYRLESAKSVRFCRHPRYRRVENATLESEEYAGGLVRNWNSIEKRCFFGGNEEGIEE